MLLPEAKERERNFKLALRMALPIFFFTMTLVIISFSQYLKGFPVSFFVAAIVLLTIAIYFIFYLIYQSIDERITDVITHTFTREYMESALKKAVQRGPYTVILVSVDNLNDINQRYGTKNGDKVLLEFTQWFGRFLQNKGIQKFPIGHYKGGDFLIGLEGHKNAYKSILDLLCIKAEDYMVDDIEVVISSAIVDTSVTNDVDYLIARLFELQQENRLNRSVIADDDELNPTELEASVIRAIRERAFSMMYQNVMQDDSRVMVESSVKLYDSDNKLIHQKSYLPVINRLGLSREFDTLVVENAIEQCSHFDGGTVIAVTLFPSTVRNPAFFEKMQVLFANNPAAQERILFVLCENEYYTHLLRYNELLQSYRRLGIFIALDRLGAYQTTLLYLKELKVDVVRFDVHYGKYIKEKGYQSLLKGLNLGAQSLGVKTWVKMIEDDEAKEIAESIGVDYLQGNCLGKIAPLNELESK